MPKTTLVEIKKNKKEILISKNNEMRCKDNLEVMGFIRNPTIENLNIGLIQMPQSQEDAAWEAEAVEMPASSGRK